MPRKLGRASTADLDQLHGLAVRAITRDLKAALKSKDATPVQLLRAILDLLKISDTTEGVREKSNGKTHDPLKGVVPDFSGDGVMPAPASGDMPPYEDGT